MRGRGTVLYRVFENLQAKIGFSPLNYTLLREAFFWDQVFENFLKSGKICKEFAHLFFIIFIYLLFYFAFILFTFVFILKIRGFSGVPEKGVPGRV